MRKKDSKSSVYFLLWEFYKCSLITSPVSTKDGTHPKYIQKYIWKYLSWLQGENRKLHKISGAKNLTESVHRKISHTMQNFAWRAKFFGCLKWFRMVCEISHNHAKMLVVGFLPLVFFLASLIGLAKGYEVFQSLDSSSIWALTCIAMDFTKFSLIPGLFQWLNSHQKHQNSPKLISNPC